MLVKFNSQALLNARENKCTQAQLAEAADTTIRYIRDLEHGIKTQPSASMVYRISKVLEVSMESLMLELNEPEDP